MSFFEFHTKCKSQTSILVNNIRKYRIKLFYIQFLSDKSEYYQKIFPKKSITRCPGIFSWCMPNSPSLKAALKLME